MARGNAFETRDTEPNMKNFVIMVISSPFSTKSSTHLHISCIMKMKRQIKKVAIRFFKNDFVMKRSNFFM